MPSTKPHATRQRERYKNDPEYRARTREYQREYRKRRYHAEPEFRAKTRASSVRYLDDGNRAARNARQIVARRERVASDPEYAARLRQQRRDYKRRLYARDPAVREKQRLANAKYRARRKAAAEKPAP